MKRKNEKIIEEKYPESYFEHYIAMFKSEVNSNGFKEHTNTYIQIEGLDEFKKLVDEIELIEKNNDWDLFVNICVFHKPKVLNEKNIKNLAAIAIEISKQK